MLGCWRLSPTLTISSSVNRPCRGFHCRAVSAQSHENGVENVVIVGSGWAGLSAAHHLSKQVVLSTCVFFMESAYLVDVLKWVNSVFRVLMSKFLMMDMVLVAVMMSAFKVSDICLYVWCMRLDDLLKQLWFMFRCLMCRFDLHTRFLVSISKHIWSCWWAGY